MTQTPGNKTAGEKYYAKENVTLREEFNKENVKRKMT